MTADLHTDDSIQITDLVSTKCSPLIYTLLTFPLKLFEMSMKTGAFLLRTSVYLHIAAL